MQIYLAKRVALALLVVVGVSAVVFGALRLSGDPAALLLPPNAGREDYAQLRRRLGLDRPLPEQYARFLARLARGDLGASFQTREPALRLAAHRLPATGELALATLVLIVVVAIPLGIISAAVRNTPFDQAVSVVTLAGQAMPNYWFAIMLILLIAVDLKWLPTSGMGGFRHLILPVIALASQPASRSVRLVRAEMSEVLHQDYVRTARAKGLPGWYVLLRHGLHNAAIPVVTLVGLDVGFLLGGAIVTETVFAWPGIGSLLINAVGQRDFPVIQAAVVLIAGMVVLVNLLVDVSYVALDPRIRFE